MTQTGTVRFYDHNDGHGYIILDDGGPDICIRGRGLARAGLLAVRRGERLRFTTIKRNGRAEARDIARMPTLGTFP